MLNKKIMAFSIIAAVGCLIIITILGNGVTEVDAVDNKAKTSINTSKSSVQNKESQSTAEANEVKEKNPANIKKENSTTAEVNEEKEKKTVTLTMVATAYTADPAENGPWGPIAYDGQALRRGIVAVDPNVIPMGTRLYIEGYGEAIAADQGSAIKGNRIDLFMDTKTEAFNWGMREVKVTILD